jgi:hypothetical protein
MSSTYLGRLAVEGDLALEVDLRFEGENLEIRTPKESLGRWPLHEVFVSRLESGIFRYSSGLTGRSLPPPTPSHSQARRFRRSHKAGTFE